jgi:hypothetical protein
MGPARNNQKTLLELDQQLRNIAGFNILVAASAIGRVRPEPYAGRILKKPG